MPMLRVAVAVLLCACDRSPAPSSSPVQSKVDEDARYSGILIFKNLGERKFGLRWLDLATLATGEIENANNGHEALYPRDRSAVWLRGEDDLRATAVRVTRDAGGVTTRVVPNVSLVSVSPDEQRAVVASAIAFPDKDPLMVARVAADGFDDRKPLGLDESGNAVIGWLPDGTVLVELSKTEELVRVAPGMAPQRIRERRSFTLSHDAQLVAWTTDNETKDTSVASIGPLSGTAKAREVDLGPGRLAGCRFAPDDRTLGCALSRSTMDKDFASVTTVDIASGKPTSLGDAADAYQVVFSPDSRAVVLSGDPMMIVRVDGSGRTRVAIAGEPVAWIR